MSKPGTNTTSSSSGNGSGLKPNQLPVAASVGLKIQHCDEILRTKPDLSWFEVHPENYLGAGGPPHHYLTQIREKYELSMHGVGLSIGGATRPSKEHMKRLKGFAERYQPASFSEHLAWSSHEAGYFNDLLPLPLTEETCGVVCDHIDEIQSTLNHRLLLENPSTYIEFAEAPLTEIDFLTEVASRTGCGLLLDVNNVYVSCTNHRTNTKDYIDSFPMQYVGEIHLGGHANDEDDLGDPLLIDAHDRQVIEEVWKLYERAINRAGPHPTLVEWDNDVPDWATLYGEAKRAEEILRNQQNTGDNQASTSEGHQENEMA